MGSAAPVAAELDEALSPRQTTSNVDKAIHDSPTTTRAVSNALDSINMRADPDAQATVTDFLDFTEYLPSDMMRSLTLIGKLDERYLDASANLNDLATTWGQLPALPQDKRPLPVQLRAQISENLGDAVSARVSSHAEARRMVENVTKHAHRAKSILSKLIALRDNWPPPEEQKSPVATRSPQMTRGSKVTIRGDGQKVRRQQVPRITVPGEVLAPYELNYETYGSGSESSSEEADEPASPPPTVSRAPSRVTNTPAPQPRIKLVKPPKPPKTPKTPKPRISLPPPASVPELSTAKVLANLQPPPDNAVPGSADAPWLQLTTYELAKLRKRMKKNAAWAPSDTMVARELKTLGRGAEAYNAAKRKAEEEGVPFEYQVPAPVVDDSTGAMVMPQGALSMETATVEEKSLSRRPLKPKPSKKDDLARLAAEEAEASARKMMEAAKAMFTPSHPPSITEQASQAKPEKKSMRKRKRDSVAETDAEKPDGLEIHAQRPPLKRNKTETPVPHPLLGSNATPQPSQETGVQQQHLNPNAATAVMRTTPVPVPIPGQDQSAKTQPAASPASVTNENASTGIAAPTPARPPTETPIPPPVRSTSPRKSSTPILPPIPPIRETRKSQAARLQEQQQTSNPTSASSTKPPSRPASSAGRAATPAVEATEASQSGTSGPTTRRPASRGKAASQEPLPSLASDRPRRASTARNTPAPPEAALPARPVSRRQQKRPAPGVVSRTNSGGKSAVGRRKAAPKKKNAAASKAGGIVLEVDDEGQDVDPNEPRYCICNGVSFGTMIQCDNDTCDKEWFHLECVGLPDVPARTTKWYCPDCRVRLKIGEKGEITARGVKT
ncbi:hypothetical protein GE09DRAFT_99797 [Coniochaeta sp. 2T2.1]|nr:hypothetical protein GE09DRAFT_99797 [Coniochaeta sp. 2T2.1]